MHAIRHRLILMVLVVVAVVNVTDFIFRPKNEAEMLQILNLALEYGTYSGKAEKEKHFGIGVIEFLLSHHGLAWFHSAAAAAFGLCVVCLSQIK